MAESRESMIGWRTTCWAMGVAAVLATGVAAAAATIAPYGTWRSPISAQSLAEGAVRLSNLQIENGALYWNETRPAENGRRVILRDASGEVNELTPNGFNVRTRVHEYGGLSYVATANAIYFSNFADQRLYEQRGQEAPRAMTPEGYRYADCVAVAHPFSDTLVCVREDHTAPNGDVVNAIVAVKHSGGEPDSVLFDGSDFVAYPRVSQDGKQLAWISWNHPDMPFDSTTLRVADLSSNGLTHVRVVAGGGKESVMEPQWDRDGALYFSSDRNGFWNLFAWRDGRTRSVLQMSAEFANPLWWLGQSNYALTGDGFAVARYSIDMVDHLAVIDLERGHLREIHLPFVGYESVQLRDRNHAVMIANSADKAPVIISVDLRTGAAKELRRTEAAAPDAAYVSRGEPIDLPTAEGREAHAFYYAPRNANYSAPAGELPPLIVAVHGGPTIASSPEYRSNIQYWTSRGFAVADVNYGGSSGYGRAYRERLRGQWGIVDVQDAVAVAQFLGKQGKADPARLLIRGGSAGGYTVLSALSQSSVFRAGADYFGVSDLAVMARDTHKFESRYLDGLVAPYPSGRAIYEARSPLNHLSTFKAPLLVLQGEQDRVVPKNQSQMIVDSLKRRGSAVAYLEFSGEGHGFVKAESIRRAAEAELYFYGKVLGFTPADSLPELEIANADALRR